MKTASRSGRSSRARLLLTFLGGVATALCAIPVAQLVFITTNVAGAGVLSARLDGAPSEPMPPST